MNGDSYTDVDLAELVTNHHKAKAGASVVVVPADGRGDCGSVQLDGSGKLASFEEKQGQFHERRYVHCHETFQFQNGIFELCRAAQNLGYLLVVVTNQAEIARGYYTEQDFLRLTEWMIARFAQQQIRIARVYYCPYHPVHGIGGYKRDSPDRKPKPGMLLRAQRDFDLNLLSSVLIGDQVSDMQAARAGDRHEDNATPRSRRDENARA